MVLTFAEHCLWSTPGFIYKWCYVMTTAGLFSSQDNNIQMEPPTILDYFHSTQILGSRGVYNPRIQITVKKIQFFRFEGSMHLVFFTCTAHDLLTWCKEGKLIIKGVHCSVKSIQKLYQGHGIEMLRVYLPEADRSASNKEKKTRNH